MLNVFQLAEDIKYFKKTIDRLAKKQTAISEQLATVIKQLAAQGCGSGSTPKRSSKNKIKHNAII
jgi:hypothetical protein